MISLLGEGTPEGTTAADREAWAAWLAERYPSYDAVQVDWIEGLQQMRRVITSSVRVHAQTQAMARDLRMPEFVELATTWIGMARQLLDIIDTMLANPDDLNVSTMRQVEHLAREYSRQGQEIFEFLRPRWGSLSETSRRVLADAAQNAEDMLRVFTERIVRIVDNTGRALEWLPLALGGALALGLFVRAKG